MSSSEESVIANSSSTLQHASKDASSSADEAKFSLVELKNGKVVFKQKPLSLEKHSETMQATVAFRSMLEKRVEKRLEPLCDFPSEHLALIAKLAFESDKTASVLAKHIRQELIPADDMEDDTFRSAAFDALPLNIIEVVVKNVMTRVNYGLEPPLGVKTSSGIFIWRWEVKEQHKNWLPRNIRDKAEIRLAERVQAKKDLALLYEALSDEEKEKYLPSCKVPSKVPVKDSVVVNQAMHSTSSTDENRDIIKEAQKRVPEGDENETSSKGKGRQKRAVDSEKAIKDKEKAEKKAAKVEKEKKDREAQSKSRSLMANFFNKPKASSSHTSTKSPALAETTLTQTDFEKTFKPYVVKKDTVMAPANWFLQPRMRFLGRDVIVIDDDTAQNVQPQGISQSMNVSNMNEKDRLRSVLSSMPQSTRGPRSRVTRIEGGDVVRDVVKQLSEAEVTGDTALVRSLVSKLANRSLFPAKVFIFHEDSRPGYFGTWTRSSKVIRPRRPLSKDVVALDYGYDSGEEWEEEVGGDVDDVDDGEEEEESEDNDSDMDDWLVDDDEPSTPLEDRGQSPMFLDLPAPPKRKAADREGNLSKKRKVVVPLVPYVKGPSWETTIGECDLQPFQSYQIRLLNDSPFPLDPFTFVSADLKTASNVSETVFAVPVVPNRQTDIAPLAGPAAATKKPAGVPKTVFPETHLPFLLNTITSLQTASLAYLVEAVYQELRTYKLKKNAIEAKIREVGEKCKDKKYWVVRQGIPTPAQETLNTISC